MESQFGEVEAVIDYFERFRELRAPRSLCFLLFGAPDLEFSAGCVSQP